MAYMLFYLNQRYENFNNINRKEAEMFTKRKEGFTLVEIMIVVEIIGLLVAIAIPNLLRARLSANEAAAKASMRTIITALENYRADMNPPSYPDELTDMSGATPPYLEPVLASGRKQGYNFDYDSADSVDVTIAGVTRAVFPAYSLTASPVTEGTSGNAKFYANSTGIIYADTTPPYADPPADYSADVPDGYMAIGN